MDRVCSVVYCDLPEVMSSAKVRPLRQELQTACEHTCKLSYVLLMVPVTQSEHLHPQALPENARPDISPLVQIYTLLLFIPTHAAI